MTAQQALEVGVRVRRNYGPRGPCRDDSPERIGTVARIEQHLHDPTQYIVDWDGDDRPWRLDPLYCQRLWREALERIE